MKKLLLLLFVLPIATAYAQAPKLYIQIVSHNEPTDSLHLPLKYAEAKAHVLTLADMVVAEDARWNLQTSDGFVMGARADEIATGTNIFKTLADPPYNDHIAIDCRSKNFPNRNIADQWYLLDSLGGNPTTTVGGFIYYVCQPSSMTPDWWVYQDSVTGEHYGNRVKFDLLSGAGSAGAVLHCNDLHDFGIFKPDTTTDFYSHNPDRSIWDVGTGCSLRLLNAEDEQEIISTLKGQVDSIQIGLWPQDKFYVTRVMAHQREYQPSYFPKVETLIDSINAIGPDKIVWATVEETFAAFQAWQISSGLDHSQWLCGESTTTVQVLETGPFWKFFPNPVSDHLVLEFGDTEVHRVEVHGPLGRLLSTEELSTGAGIDLSAFPPGILLLRIDGSMARVIKQ